MVLVCFDWDGTIADSWPIYKKAAIDYCNSNTLPIPTDKELKRCFGNTQWEGLKHWGKNWEEQDKHRFGTYDVFYDYLKDPANIKLIHDIENTIELCKVKGFKMAIITSRFKTPLLEALKHHQLEQVFQTYITRDCAAEMDFRDKPYPDMLEHIILKQKVTSKETIMIGDTEMDIKMARNAKCKNIAVTWGMREEKELKQSNPTYICSQPTQLGQKILELVKEAS